MRWKFPGEKQERLREYTISEFPKNNEYRITVRYIPGGKVTTYIHEKLAVGDIVQVSPRVVIVITARQRNMVMLAGGNGVVALAPMIEKGLAEGRKVKFLYSNRSTETRSFGQFLEISSKSMAISLRLSSIYHDAGLLIRLISIIDGR